MKDVNRKDLPEIAGGEFTPDGCIPDPFKLGPWPDVGYPQDPVVPGPDTTVDA